MDKTDRLESNPFKDAVSKCDEIRDTYKPGLIALGGNSAVIKVKDTKKLNGSVDIDASVKKSRPQEARWDYTLGYRDNAYFVEVHPADTKNVEEMIKKVIWLKNWLSAVAPDLKKLHKCGVYHWIPSGRVRILKTSPQYKKISSNNLSITKILELE